MKRFRLATLILTAWLVVAVAAASAATLKAPDKAVAGAGFSLATSGQGSATFYLVGPGAALKREVNLGSDISIAPKEAEYAGRYVAILRAGGQTTEQTFWVSPAKVEQISFLARPSRLPVAVPNGISGVAYTFDNFGNLVLQPLRVNFQISVAGAPSTTRSVTTKNGVASVQADSGHKEGAAQFVASVGDVSARRVVQLVASDPCNLRIEASRVSKGIEVKTAPIRDCSGNPVPDGTIVTITAQTSSGKSTVDARIKRGIAAAEFPTKEPALISVASGVVLGNQVQVGGGQ